MGTEHADQGFFCAIAFSAQYADSGLAATKRARRWSSIENLDFAMIGQIFGIGLKKNPGEHLIGMSCSGVIVGFELFAAASASSPPAVKSGSPYQKSSIARCHAADPLAANVAAAWARGAGAIC